MRLIYNEDVNFFVEELYLDADRKRVTSVAANFELRISEYVSDGNDKIYDWNDGTFKAGAPTTEKDDCSHVTAGGVNTGRWENDTAIVYGAFTQGKTYYFEFYDSDEGIVVGEYEIQWGGNYGGTLMKEGDYNPAKTAAQAGDAMDLITNALGSAELATSAIVDIVAGVLAGIIDVVDLKTALKEIKAAVKNKGTWNRDTGAYVERDDADGADVNAGVIADDGTIVTRTPS